MRNIFVLMFILSLSYFGCREKPNDSQSSITKHNKSNNDSLFYSVVKLFALPYPENFTLDSNTLIFYGSRPFDTSFLIQLKNEPQKVAGVYYEVIPTYHNDINNFAGSANNLLFFEGYSFTLDLSNWERIKSQAERLLADSTPFNIKNACRDCEEYGLYYGIKSNIGNTIKYRPFYRFLKEQYLDSFNVRRKPIMYKVK